MTDSNAEPLQQGSSLQEFTERAKGLEIQLLRRAAIADPYPIYHELREFHGPMTRSPNGYWLVSGHTHCAELLRASHLGALGRLSTRPDVPAGRYPFLEQFCGQFFLFADPPAHDELRRTVSACVGDRLQHAMTELAPELAERLVDGIDWSVPTDIVDQLAVPMPTAIMASVLGVPLGHLPCLRAWAVAVSESIELFYGARRLARAEQAARSFHRYFLSGAWTANEEEGALAALIDGTLCEVDVGIANAAFLLVSAHETTVNFIGMSVLALLRDPSALAAFRTTDTRQAVEELLRYTSPIQFAVRRVSESHRYAAHDLERGDLVVLCLGAANRDPTVFDEPDALRPGRSPNAHLAFGAGVHACFGAALARTEARCLLPHVLPVLEELRVDADSVRWQRKHTIRGLERLVVVPRSSAG